MEADRLFPEFEACTLCPWQCGVNRNAGKRGVCGGGSGYEISSIVAHHGEEPVISGENGICNVFYTHCNLKCRFCQNHQISQPGKNTPFVQSRSLETVLEAVEQFLSQGITHVGFVSPGHFIPQTRAIIMQVKSTFPETRFVYNTNAYDLPSGLQTLEGLIDVYLPDFKYAHEALGRKLSGVKDYPKIALQAIREMKRQKGLRLHCNEEGLAISGIIIRHLVLPGQVENSLSVLETIASEIGEEVHLSLMAQYHPVRHVNEFPEMNRTLFAEEYQQVVDRMEELGFENGWVQELDSAGYYLPDFGKDQPFG